MGSAVNESLVKTANDKTAAASLRAVIEAYDNLMGIIALSPTACSTIFAQFGENVALRRAAGQFYSASFCGIIFNA